MNSLTLTHVNINTDRRDSRCVISQSTATPGQSEKTVRGAATPSASAPRLPRPPRPDGYTKHRFYILGEIRTGSPNDETLWLPNKEMTKPCEVIDETSTNLFPHF